jgi:putative ABC transport system permease protein
MFWDTLRSDIRHTLRMAVKTPVFSALTILALALGIGATSAIFAVVNGVLLRPLPYAEADRLVNVWSHNTAENRARNPLSPANFLDFQRLNSTFDAMEAYFTFVTPQQLRTPAGTELSYSVFVTPNLINLLGRTAALGRALNVNDAPGVVVLSDGYWRRRFGADPAIVGKTVDLTQFTAQVVGVMPPNFVFPYGNMFGPSGFTRVTAVDMWLPIAFSGQQAAANRMLTQQGQIVRGTHWFGALGKLKAGVTPAMAEADLKTIAAQLEQSYPNTNKGWSATVVPTIDQTVGTVRPALLILLAGITAVLLMASVNVANLMLARSVARERELATRAALGAGRARLVQQCLTESLLFAIAGGIAGLIVMQWAIQGLMAMAPADLPRIQEVTVDARVLIVTTLTAVLAGVVVGLLPAFSSASISPQATLQEQSRGSSGGAARRRARAALVVAEVALAVALTTGAGLLIRSFVRVVNIDPGFQSEHLLTWQMNIPTRLQNADDRRAFYRDFFARIQGLPGVLKVGGTTRLPLGSTAVSTLIEIEGRAMPQSQLPEVEFRRAMHDYFDAMGIPVLRGRGFNADDGPTAPGVAMINQTMAGRFWPNQDPVGQHVKMSGQQSWLTIVGVVGDVRHLGLEEVPKPELYITYLQNPPVNPFIVIRTAGDPAALAETVRSEARALDKELPIYDIRTMETLRSETVAQRRFVLLLVAAFGVLALGLAAIGVYGVMSVIVSERTREVGVRLALGAEPFELLKMVVGQAARLAVVGVVVGVAVVVPLAPLLASQLYGITAFDPTTFGTVVVVLMLTAVLAAIIPARRAMRVDPITALRYE